MDKTTQLYKKLSRVYNHMIERCYNPNIKEYWMYGYKGVGVDHRWHSKTDFLIDAINLPHWDEEKFLSGDIQLDKDLTPGQIKNYGPDNCQWIDKDVNRKSQRSKQRLIEATSPEGVVTVISNQSQFTRDNNLIQDKISMVALGKRPHHKGWKFKIISDYLTIYTNEPQLMIKREFIISKKETIILKTDSIYEVLEVLGLQYSDMLYRQLIKGDTIGDYTIDVNFIKKYKYMKLTTN